MLSIQRPNPKIPALECVPNLLPCRIHHDGPVNASNRYWAPQPVNDENPEAYFRGRKLKGRELMLPETRRGLVVKEGAKENVPHRRSVERLRRSLEDDEDGDDEKEEVKVIEEVADFYHFIVWGQEAVVDGNDAFVKGVEEWIKFAEAVGPPFQNIRSVADGMPDACTGVGSAG
ncbi:MAG: hypothetical protein Q9166_005574 [cf. Caloplaca sp. 2 TL-2023]